MASRSAWAYPFYIDVQGGGAEYLGTTSPLFNSGVAGPSSLGMDFTLGFYYTPIEPHGGFDLQVGIENWFLTAPQSPNYYATDVPYLTVRAQFLMAYVSAGVSPIVWRRSQLSPGVDNLSQAQNTLAYITEAGLLYPATPRFSMGVSYAMQWFTSDGIFSAQAGTSINFVMRFYFNLFGIGQNGTTAAEAPEFTGWRYINK